MGTITRKKIKQCRICESEMLQPVLHFKEMPFTDEFLPKEKLGSEFLADIDIAVCANCGCAQNINDTDMGEYYFEYTYSVQSSGFALTFMQLLALRIQKNYFGNNQHPSILEIGSGTGEQLKEFQKLGFNVIGIEPSGKLSDFANQNGVKTLKTFFDENTTSDLDPAFRKVDAVITSYTFDHIPRPVEVLHNIHRMLNDDGLLIIEVHNLDLIRQRNEFCLFEHEHYTYLDEQTLTYLLHKNKFEVLTFRLLEENEKRANSLLLVAKKSESELPAAVNVSQEINQLVLLGPEIKNSIARVDKWLESNTDKKIVAYGAGGRGIMTIAALQHPERLAYIVDKNPKSENIFAPKSHLPVFHISQLNIDRADKILVFSFGYYAEIVSELTKQYGYYPDQFISILELLEPSHA